MTRTNNLLSGKYSFIELLGFYASFWFPFPAFPQESSVSFISIVQVILPEMHTQSQNAHLQGREIEEPQRLNKYKAFEGNIQALKKSLVAALLKNGENRGEMEGLMSYLRSFLQRGILLQVFLYILQDQALFEQLSNFHRYELLTNLDQLKYLIFALICPCKTELFICLIFFLPRRPRFFCI